MNPELFFHGKLDLLGQGNDVLAFATSVMDEDEGLLLVNAHMFVAPAFPTDGVGTR